MDTITKDNIEFDLTKALIVIENDTDLDDMFKSKYGTDYPIMHALINSGTGIKPMAEKYVKGLFNQVILESTRLTNNYLSLKDEKVAESVSEPTETPIETITVIDESPKTDTKKSSNKKRWGLKAISEDIVEFFGGKPKQIHSTAKNVQELKKIFTRLEQRMWNQRFNKEVLTDAQLREISGAIETFNKKIESIVNPKK